MKRTVIETKRLMLRPFSEKDFDLIFRVYSDAEILQYTPFDPMDKDRALLHLQKVMADWQQTPRLSYEFAVCLRENGTGIGRSHILIDPETDTGMIGTLLLRDYWGQHYATEISKALIRYCFYELRLRRVNAVCNPENFASWTMLEKCGLRREACLIQKCRYVKKGVVSWHD